VKPKLKKTPKQITYILELNDYMTRESR
jgi:hypothetical protein